MQNIASAFDLDSGDWRSILEDEVRRYVRSGGKMRRLSERTGLAEITIRKLVYGETQSPRMTTVLRLLLAFDYQITVTRRGSKRENPLRENLRVVG